MSTSLPGWIAALPSRRTTAWIDPYPGTQHGFHNDSTPRYNKDAAERSWERTIAFFKKTLA